LQIWIEPEQKGLTPSYEQRTVPDSDKRNQLRLIASRDGRNDSVKIHQQADVYASLLDVGQKVEHRFAAQRQGWLQVIAGDISLNGQRLKTGDGAVIEDETDLQIAANEPTEFLLFDLAAE